LQGREDAWSALLDKYKNLIFSIPIKYGFSTDEAAEIFQGVCLELLAGLPTQREPHALPKWLIQVTSHKCSHRKQQEQRWVSGEEADAKFTSLFTAPENAEKALREAEREQLLRQALSDLSPRAHTRRLPNTWDSPRARSDSSGAGVSSGCAGNWKRRDSDDRQT
jgi:RNA polymerase sigma-70 factor (ECF subfamily)